MTPQQRDLLIETLADKWTDHADTGELMSYFRDGQVAYLEDLTEPDLENLASIWDINLG